MQAQRGQQPSERPASGPKDAVPVVLTALQPVPGLRHSQQQKSIPRGKIRRRDANLGPPEAVAPIREARATGWAKKTAAASDSRGSVVVVEALRPRRWRRANPSHRLYGRGEERKQWSSESGLPQERNGMQEETMVDAGGGLASGLGAVMTLVGALLALAVFSLTPASFLAHGY